MDYNKPIIRYLETFYEQENNVFKKKAYKKVIDNIRGIKIEKIEDISNITGIGEKIKAKIQFVIDNHEKEEIDEDLTIIYGIGPAKLKTLHSKGIKTIKQFDVEEVILPKKFELCHKMHQIIYSKSLSYYFKDELKAKK